MSKKNKRDALYAEIWKAWQKHLADNPEFSQKIRKYWDDWNDLERIRRWQSWWWNSDILPLLEQEAGKLGRGESIRELVEVFKVYYE